MEYIVTGDEMKEYDNNTITHFGIPALELMENAAKALCDEIISLSMEHKKILIVCGVGNNGGDGLALARLLSQKDFKVSICILGDANKGSESFFKQHNRSKSCQVSFISADQLLKAQTDSYNVVVDAVFGVGLSRDITGVYGQIIEKCNQLRGYKLAVDIPSGICANTGNVLGCAFQADSTITFAFHKLGLCMYPGCIYAGDVKVADIGITEKAFEQNPPQIFTYKKSPMEYLPIRKPDGNKGTFGKVIVIAGFDTMIGAAILCSRAVLQMGTGMVKVLCDTNNRGILQAAVPEAMYCPVDDLKESIKWSDCIVMGPGLGRNQKVIRLLEGILAECDLPLVLDADALNIISESLRLRMLLRNYKSTKILTPHVGELARMAELSNKDVKEDLLNIAKSMAMEYHSIVVAKDARTFVVREEGPVYLNISGNNGMATAGSGDVLAGMVVSLLAQGLKPFEAACTGVYLHGLAGDYARDVYTEYGVTASRIIENIRLFEQRND